MYLLQLQSDNFWAKSTRLSLHYQKTVTIYIIISYSLKDIGPSNALQVQTFMDSCQSHPCAFPTSISDLFPLNSYNKIIFSYILLTRTHEHIFLLLLQFTIIILHNCNNTFKSVEREWVYCNQVVTRLRWVCVCTCAGQIASHSLHAMQRSSPDG